MDLIEQLVLSFPHLKNHIVQSVDQGNLKELLTLLLHCGPPSKEDV